MVSSASDIATASDLHRVLVVGDVFLDVLRQRGDGVVQPRAAVGLPLGRGQLVVDRRQQQDRQRGDEQERVKRVAAQVASTQPDGCAARAAAAASPPPADRRRTTATSPLSIVCIAIGQRVCRR